jgi:hypothetical protein
LLFLEAAENGTLTEKNGPDAADHKPHPGAESRDYSEASGPAVRFS